MGLGVFLGGVATGARAGMRMMEDYNRSKREDEKWQYEKGKLDDEQALRERRKQADAEIEAALKAQQQQLSPQPAPTQEQIEATQYGDAPIVEQPRIGVQPSGGGQASNGVNMANVFAAKRDAYLKHRLWDDAEAAHAKYANLRQQELKDNYFQAVRERGVEGALNFFSDEGILPNGRSYSARVDPQSGQFLVDVVDKKEGKVLSTLPFENAGHAISYGYGLINGQEFKDYMKLDFERRKTAADEARAAAAKATADAAVADRDDKRRAGYWESEVRKNDAQAGASLASADHSRALAGRAREDKEPADVRIADALMKRMPGLSFEDAWGMVRTGKTKDTQQAVNDTATRLMASQNPRYAGQSGMRNALDDAAQIWGATPGGGAGSRAAGGAVKYPQAPADRSQRRIGQIYVNPNGVPARWTEQGWEML